MNLFWPVAIIFDDKNKKAFSQFTTNACLSVDDAMNAIETWREIYNSNLLCAYIKDSEKDQVVYLENNVDTMGNIRKKTPRKK